MLSTFLQHHSDFPTECAESHSGTTYRVGDIVVTGKEGGEPVFGRIMKIFYEQKEDQCILIVNTMNSYYYYLYHAYHVTPTSHQHAITPLELAHFRPYNTHTCFDSNLSTHQFVCTKHHIL